MSIIKDVVDRGVIEHKSKVVGETNYGNKIFMYLPKDEAGSTTLVVGGIHGDEPESVVFLSAALRTVKGNNLCHYVIPCLNPDGITMGMRANSNKVDINRNFPASNWSEEEVRYTWSSDEDIKVALNSGDVNNSEEETKSLIDVILKLGIRTVIAVHAPLNFVEGKLNSNLARMIAINLDIPYMIESTHQPGSLASWCQENDIEIVTLELPSITIDRVISDFSSKFVNFLVENDIDD